MNNNVKQAKGLEETKKNESWQRIAARKFASTGKGNNGCMDDFAFGKVEIWITAK